MIYSAGKNSRPAKAGSYLKADTRAGIPTTAAAVVVYHGFRSHPVFKLCRINAGTSDLSSISTIGITSMADELFPPVRNHAREKSKKLNYGRVAALIVSHRSSFSRLASEPAK